MRRALGALAAAALPAAPAAGGVPWYLVDAPLVVCPGSPHEVRIQIPLDSIPESEREYPHILTLFRASTEAVTLELKLTDASSSENETAEARNISLEDLGNSSRRLSPGLDRAALAADLHEEGVHERRLRGGGHSSGFSGGSRGSSSGSRVWRPSWSSSRRRAPPSTPVAPSSSSWPAAPALAPPGGAPAPRARGGPHGPAGSYGYPSPEARREAFGGHPPAQTNYGYSGAGAWDAGRSANVAVAAGGAGALAGVGGASAYNRPDSWRTRLHETCWAGDFEFDTCAQCEWTMRFMAFLFQDSKCEARYVPPNSLARDDLNVVVFVPADVTGPMTLTITALAGAAYAPSKICPESSPAADNATDGNSSAADNATDGNSSAADNTTDGNSSAADNASDGSGTVQDGKESLQGEAEQFPFMFVTLTSLTPEETGDTAAATEQESAAATEQEARDAGAATGQEPDPLAKRVVWGLGALCLFGCCVAYTYCEEPGATRNNMVPAQDPPSQHGQHSPAQFRPQQGRPQSGQPQHGQPQQGQPQHGHPQHGQPLYGLQIQEPFEQGHPIVEGRVVG